MWQKFSLAIATLALSGAVVSGNLLSAGPAAAQSIGVHIANTESDDMFVTLTDMNSRKKVLDEARINRGSRTTVDLLKDGEGRARVSWTAKIDSTDARKVKCGKGEQSRIDVGSEVKLTARSSC